MTRHQHMAAINAAATAIAAHLTIVTAALVAVGLAL